MVNEFLPTEIRQRFNGAPKSGIDDGCPVYPLHQYEVLEFGGNPLNVGIPQPTSLLWHIDPGFPLFFSFPLTSPEKTVTIDTERKLQIVHLRYLGRK